MTPITPAQIESISQAACAEIENATESTITEENRAVVTECIRLALASIGCEIGELPTSASLEKLDSLLPKPSKRFDAAFAQLPTILSEVPDFTAAWIDFVRDRAERRKPVTIRAAAAILSRCSERPAQSVMALRECIERGWMSFKWEYFERHGSKPAAPMTAADKIKGYGI